MVALWVGNLTDDWIVVKWEVMQELSNSDRSLFGVRDRDSKLHAAPNDMETELIAFWKKLTGVQLVCRDYKARRDLNWWSPDDD